MVAVMVVAVVVVCIVIVRVAVGVVGGVRRGGMRVYVVVALLVRTKLAPMRVMRVRALRSLVRTVLVPI